MNIREARELEERLASLVQDGQIAEAYARLAPVLAERTPFSNLGRIGELVGVGPLGPANAFLEYIAVKGTMGGWAMIGSALGQQLDRDLNGAFSHCRDFITLGDTWYVTEILGERLPGLALVAHFYPSLDLLVPWRSRPARVARVRAEDRPRNSQ